MPKLLGVSFLQSSDLLLSSKEFRKIKKMKSIKTTPIHQWHQENGAKMVEFSGWEMPIQYKGILAEHKQTRSSVSLFDVSHMGEFFIEGPEGEEALQKIVTNDLKKLVPGQVQYTLMLHENGTVIDDLTVYKISKDRFMLCVNAANVQKDFDWICSNIKGKCTVQNWSDTFAQIAVQGKHSESILQELCEGPLNEIEYYHFIETAVGEASIVLARMGYTGEDGFEIFCKREDAQSIWNKIMEKGKKWDIAPAGLGARDLLRLEMGFCLYGNDLDENHVAKESNLDPFISMDKPRFIGKDALEKFDPEKHKKLIRFVVEGKGIPRTHYKIFAADSDQQIGEVSSGNHSPILNQGIGMGYVDYIYADGSKKIEIEIRDKKFPVKIIKGSFIKVKK